MFTPRYVIELPKGTELPATNQLEDQFWLFSPKAKVKLGDPTLTTIDNGEGAGWLVLEDHPGADGEVIMLTLIVGEEEFFVHWMKPWDELRDNIHGDVWDASFEEALQTHGPHVTVDQVYEIALEQGEL